MKTVCENCGKVIDTSEAIQTSAYSKYEKYDHMQFFSIKCVAEFFKKEVENGRQ